MKFIALILCLLFINDSTAESTAPTCDKAKLKQQMQADIHQYNGLNVLVLSGEIKSDSANDVGPFIRNTQRYEEVWMCSGGGSVHGGIEIGKALNSVKATVRTPNNYLCASACTIAAMGGYARIIDPGARFVTHASSAFGSFGFEIEKEGVKYSHFSLFDCDKPEVAEFCGNLRAFIKTNKLSETYSCADPEDVRKAGANCAFFDTDGQGYRENVLVTNSLITLILKNDSTLTSMAIAIGMKSSVAGELDLLEYFQRMLLDGRRDLIDYHGYRQIRSNFRPKNIYSLPASDTYHRSLESDMDAMEKANNEIDAFAVWQTILTDRELSLKAQISQYIKSNNIGLGMAGEDALKIFDSMRTCQIQSSCRLESHTAKALGYDNLYDH